jgi:CHAD domain-containing protein
MKWKASHTAAANAHRRLPAMAEEYFKEGRKAGTVKRSPKALHNFRIATKRFRYALELFRPIYGPSLDSRLSELHELQNSLGKISDYQTVLEILKGDKELEAKLQRALKRKSKEFRRRWQAFDSGSQLKQWKRYLGSGPRSVAAKRPKRASTQ